MDSGNVLVHGDNNQAIANTCWWPLRFVCAASVRVPPAHAVRAVPAGGTALDTSPELPHQLGCRISSTTGLQQRWTLPANSGIRELRVPVFQRTANLGSEDQDAAMNGDLNARAGGAAVRKDDQRDLRTRVDFMVAKICRPEAAEGFANGGADHDHTHDEGDERMLRG